jgi:S-adenosylmethionine decarboxylase
LEKDYEFNTFGRMAYADFWGVNKDTLNDMAYLELVSRIAIKRSEATILKNVDYKFTPQGCTILFLLSESHYAIHTAPEHGYIAIDVFTCSDRCHPDKTIDYLALVLQPTIVKRNSVIRGVQ